MQVTENKLEIDKLSPDCRRWFENMGGGPYGDGDVFLQVGGRYIADAKHFERMHKEERILSSLRWSKAGAGWSVSLRGEVIGRAEFWGMNDGGRRAYVLRGFPEKYRIDERPMLSFAWYLGAAREEVLRRIVNAEFPEVCRW